MPSDPIKTTHRQRGLDTSEFDALILSAAMLFGKSFTTRQLSKNLGPFCRTTRVRGALQRLERQGLIREVASAWSDITWEIVQNV